MASSTRPLPFSDRPLGASMGTATLALLMPLYARSALADVGVKRALWWPCKTWSSTAETLTLFGVFQLAAVKLSATGARLSWPVSGVSVTVTGAVGAVV